VREGGHCPAPLGTNTKPISATTFGDQPHHKEQRLSQTKQEEGKGQKWSFS